LLASLQHLSGSLQVVLDLKGAHIFRSIV